MAASAAASGDLLPPERLLDFGECLADTPAYRQRLEAAEHEMESLERRLQQVVDASTLMVQRGEVFGQAVSGFLGSLRNLAEDPAYAEDGIVCESLRRFASVLEELESHRSLLLMQAKTTVTDSLRRFLNTRVRNVKDTGKVVHQLDGQLDQCRARFAAAPRSKPHECLEARNLLTAMQAGARHTSLDYAFQINVAQTQERAEIAEKVLAYMSANLSYFLQGYDALKDLEPYMKAQGQRLVARAKAAKAQERIMEQSHAAIQQREETIRPDLSSNTKEGYLYNRSQASSKSWTWRYFKLVAGQLIYCSRHQPQPMITAVRDLRLCSVKSQPSDTIDRQYCFEVVTPARSLVLQALSQRDHDEWVSAIQNAIGMALDEGGQPDDSDTAPLRHSDSYTSLPPTPPPGDLNGLDVQSKEKISAVPSNRNCADCTAPDPTWASINLGLTLCIQCSGIHRSLGTHVSKVRSLTLDRLESNLCQMMVALGNKAGNGVYEATLGPKDAARKPGPMADRKSREAWIRQKYIERRFIRPHPSAQERLFSASASGDLAGILEGLASGADVNARNAGGDTALLEAIRNNHLLCAELLLQNGADIQARGCGGRTALHYATDIAQLELVCMLLKRGADTEVPDDVGQTPLAVALSKQYADLVTLLRLAVMQKEEAEENPASSDWIGLKLKDFERLPPQQPPPPS